MMNLMEGLVVLPAQPEVERESRRELEVVLNKKRVGPSAGRNKGILHLNAAVVHSAVEDVCKGVPRFRTAKSDAADDSGGLDVVDGRETRLAASLQARAADQVSD